MSRPRGNGRTFPPYVPIEDFRRRKSQKQWFLDHFWTIFWPFWIPTISKNVIFLTFLRFFIFCKDLTTGASRIPPDHSCKTVLFLLSNSTIIYVKCVTFWHILARSGSRNPDPGVPGSWKVTFWGGSRNLDLGVPGSQKSGQKMTFWGGPKVTKSGQKVTFLGTPPKICVFGVKSAILDHFSGSKVTFWGVRTLFFRILAGFSVRF